ncbi:MAG: ATP-binding cassette domain-containing protein, partial [Chloroflexota bacterium]|nr:ATP-binding cassette domain-containing protein [Chloroflexota bacterium]
MKVSGLSKMYETQEVLRDVSFVLNGGEKAGLVGPNGSGKSTLLRVISGLERPDAGSGWLDPGDTVGYLPQYPAEDLALTVQESLLRGAGTAGVLKGTVAELEQRMPTVVGEDLERLLGEYASAQAEFERLGGYELDDRIAGVVRGLEIDARLDGSVGALSGGNKTKLGLARLLLSDATVLLLDEPTNYLDLPALLWLERWVRESRAACVIVSHDRRFLDETVGEILEVDAQKHTVRSWPGNYSAYANAKSREVEKQLARWLDQEARKKRIEEDIRRTKEQARGVELGTNLDTARRYAKKVAAKAKAREGRLERDLARTEVEQPVRTWGLYLADLGKGDINDDRTVLDVHGLHAGYPGHDVLLGVDLQLRGRDRLALLGSNGSGKSTLLRCLTGMVEAEIRSARDGLPASIGADVYITSGAVRLGSGVRLGMLSQEAAELPQDETVFDVFRAGTR